ncbi:hypothetical protein DPMN_174608 [Dreissena polymorpha]|uniref:Uncharacterized protein n=1 Tax=Dreissena polymorpha TaxID=45954 RepID=A0A9D4E7F8_DREPO|nr:hypothetical protein DPMN_174608 [Dreissena polymorpha]
MPGPGVCIVAFAISASGTRLWEVGTGLDEFPGGSKFYFWLRRVFPLFLVGRAHSICVSEVSTKQDAMFAAEFFQLFPALITVRKSPIRW